MTLHSGRRRVQRTVSEPSERAQPGPQKLGHPPAKGNEGQTPELAGWLLGLRWKLPLPPTPSRLSGVNIVAGPSPMPKVARMRCWLSAVLGKTMNGWSRKLHSSQLGSFKQQPQLKAIETRVDLMPYYGPRRAPKPVDGLLTSSPIYKVWSVGGLNPRNSQRGRDCLEGQKRGHRGPQELQRCLSPTATATGLT